ncbi:toxin [Rodentibacter trehalosifermentans]|uniref:Toxin n=2 Tax=Rodentibacter TaxID=1960084 RepID=A0A1V3INY5_9PAST|nr:MULTISPECIES: type II toxin-antitoxin system RelE/ParE family toxin [Rodentibacter]OOF43831.1 toxin [Rodentibacter rarus]OOF44229.1 toxin [Rodentibacter trehalosifermentans]
MKLTFIELPPFERYRKEYLSDDEYRTFQNELLENPQKGDVIPGTNGLRKIRISLAQRGKRGGARAIYYYLTQKSRILLITAYSKNRSEDLTQEQYKILANLVKEIEELEQ